MKLQRHAVLHKEIEDLFLSLKREFCEGADETHPKTCVLRDFAAGKSAVIVSAASLGVGNVFRTVKA